MTWCIQLETAYPSRLSRIFNIDYVVAAPPTQRKNVVLVEEHVMYTTCELVVVT